MLGRWFLVTLLGLCTVGAVNELFGLTVSTERDVGQAVAGGAAGALYSLRRHSFCHLCVHGRQWVHESYHIIWQGRAPIFAQLCSWTLYEGIGWAPMRTNNNISFITLPLVESQQEFCQYVNMPSKEKMQIIFPCSIKFPSIISCSHTQPVVEFSELV